MTDLDRLLERTADAKVVLIGEATHGTAEFYRLRAALTRRLISEQGFDLVAVEGDAPDCRAVHRHVTGNPDHEDPAAVLARFDRWPRWVWANDEVCDFVAWLRGFNRLENRKVGFHGLDRFPYWRATEAVLEHVHEHDPEHLPAALQALRDPLRYADPLTPRRCADEVVRKLGSGVDARTYYAAMVGGGLGGWNARQHHMIDTVDRLLQAYGQHAKAVVWAHNAHIGDARSTQATDVVSMGQLARERYGESAVTLVGFGTYWGTTIASQVWGGPVRRMPVPPARVGSVEQLLHERGETLVFSEDWPDAVYEHRAIGVVYRPANDAVHNYVSAQMNRRYDAFLFCDHTSAVHTFNPALSGASR